MWSNARVSTVMRLQLGCFNRPVEGWLNTDITPHILVARVPFLAAVLYRLKLLTRERYGEHQRGVFRGLRFMDVTKGFPFKSNTFEAAFSSHVLEHLYPAQARFCLREVHRVLRPHGILRLAVPDLDRCVRQYNSDDPDAFCSVMYESARPGDKNRHHWMYNETSSRKLLEEVGFCEVTRQSYGAGECPDVQKIDNRPDSLFMEAKKPG